MAVKEISSNLLVKPLLVKTRSQKKKISTSKFPKILFKTDLELLNLFAGLYPKP